MKKVFLLLAVLLYSCFCTAQTPFTTLVKDPRLLKVREENGKFFYKAVYDKKVLDSFFDSTLKDKETYTTTQKTELMFFKNNSLALNLANKGENRMSINSEVIHYKLFIANPNNNNRYRYNKVNIPLLLISKISTSSDTIAKSSAYDILDYNGSPLTVRIMPSWKKDFVNFNDVIYYGFYLDLRGIQTTPDKLNLDYIWSSGLGFTYQGDSEGAKVSENGDYLQGKYSFSVIYQVATGNDTVIKSLFDTSGKFVSALQGFFIIKLGNDNPLNLRIGYQYYMKEILNGSKSNLSIALGI